MISKYSKFNTACLKLTLFYVGIIIVVSVIFSISIYHISTGEITSGLGRQSRILRDIPTEDLPEPIRNFENIRLEQQNESNHNLKLDLIYYNILILVFSFGLSYLLARKTLQPIEEAMEAQSRFTADASHELRTPLTAMKTEIEVALRNGKINLDEAKKLLNSNLEETEKLESLAGALLKLARNEDMKLNFKPVNLEETIIEAFEKIEPIAEKKSIGFENNLKNVSILGDKQSLVELFVILLDNAVKYSPKNSKIYIGMKINKNKVIITIKDEGIGIKSSDLPYIFNRFYRADSSRNKEKVDGYGLGLSIAEQIVQLHKGTIGAESKPGKGSLFKITL